MFKIDLIKDNVIINSVDGEESASLTIKPSTWDKIVLTTNERYVNFEINPLAYCSVLYLTNGSFTFEYPNEQRKRGFDRNVLDGELTVCASIASLDYRDLALNPYDMFVSDEVTPWDAEEWSNPVLSKAVEAGQITAFPHAFANRVTRDEGCFYARNAIDGKSGIGNHGDYPFNSWGGGVHEDLSIAIYFGREVCVDKLLLNLRSDYSIVDGLEHDTYWKSATLEFEDGSEISVSPSKTEKDQIFDFEKKTTSYVVLKNLVPYVNPNGMNFAALNRIGVFGTEANL